MAPDSVRLEFEICLGLELPRQAPAEAIHIYGGDFFAQARSEWDPQTLLERPYSVESAMRVFAEANARWAAERAATR